MKRMRRFAALLCALLALTGCESGANSGSGSEAVLSSVESGDTQGGAEPETEYPPEESGDIQNGVRFETVLAPEYDMYRIVGHGAGSINHKEGALYYTTPDSGLCRIAVVDGEGRASVKTYEDMRGVNYSAGVPELIRENGRYYLLRDGTELDESEYDIYNTDLAGLVYARTDDPDVLYSVLTGEKALEVKGGYTYLYNRDGSRALVSREGEDTVLKDGEENTLATLTGVRYDGSPDAFRFCEDDVGTEYIVDSESGMWSVDGAEIAGDSDGLLFAKSGGYADDLYKSRKIESTFEDGVARIYDRETGDMLAQGALAAPIALPDVNVQVANPDGFVWGESSLRYVAPIEKDGAVFLNVYDNQSGELLRSERTEGSIAEIYALGEDVRTSTEFFCVTEKNGRYGLIRIS